MVSFEDLRAMVLASTPAATGLTRGWRKFQASLKATATDPKARLALQFGAPGRVWLDEAKYSDAT